MEITDRLSIALGERYELKEEVGSGATAIVFRARDLQHSRSVALKVLRPDVAHAVGAERFLREIQISSQLTHPHILPLYDSGQADDLLYFVMPLIEGESLRDRMDREGPLPLEDALEITDQVASALEYAHKRGILHRDVKPENIMLSHGQAFLADMGIARAVGEAGTDHMTRTGLSVGTPLYMSPEQAAGEGRLDGRADIYSLACVLFEMLSGEPPFTGPTPQAVLAKHALEAVPSLRILRSALSSSMDSAVRKALEKTPADRYATPTGFARSLRKAYTDTLAGVETESWTRRWRWLPAAWTFTGVAVGALVFWLFTMGPLAPSLNLDAGALAALPFSVDPALIGAHVSTPYVTEAVSTRFSGVGGPRAVASDSVLRAWEEAGGADGEFLTQSMALQVARDLGAGLVLTARIHAQADLTVLDAQVLSVPDGAELARVEGLPWSDNNMDPILDRMTIRLLVQLSGEGRLLPDLVNRELDVVRNYLEGLIDYGAGLYSRSLERLQAATEADSTFALAGLAMVRTAEAAGDYSGTGYRIVRTYQSQLQPVDSTHFRAFRATYEGATNDSQKIYRWDRVASDYEDDGLGAYFHGKHLLRDGGVTADQTQDEAYLTRAKQALQRSLELQPGFVPALEALMDAASFLGDSAEVVRIAEELLRFDPPVDGADYVLWRLAVTTGDTAALSQARSRFGELSLPLLERIMGSAQLTGQGLTDALLAGAEHRSRGGSEEDLWGAALLNRALLLNLGRPRAGVELETYEPFTWARNNFAFVIEAVFLDGDRGRAEAEAEESLAMLQRTELSRYSSFTHRCILGLWGLSLGDSTGVGMAIDSLRVWEPTTRSTNLTYLCAAVLEVQRGLLTQSDELRAQTELLDNLMRVGPAVEGHMEVAANLTLARAWGELGNLQRALGAARRRSHHPTSGPLGLAAMLRQDGRLAALTGDVQGAAAAYRHYLALRYDPEDSLRPAVDSVRAELARLNPGTGGGNTG